MSAPTVRIAYVYAAPLVRRVEDERSRQWVAVDRLDVQREKMMLTRVIARSGRAVRWKETVATSGSFWQVVLHGCRVLHFTGHGMRDGSVCFEDEFGRMHSVTRDALKALFTKGHARAEAYGSDSAGVKCVFVSACHSESVAEAFVAAGVPHVVAVRTEDEIMDDASLKFASAFYEALLADSCQSVKQAFESAKTVVKLTAEDWAASEHTKFLLLGRGDANERLFADANAGDWVDETPRITDLCPRPVEQFTAREYDVQAIYNDVLHSRCVVVIGACGIGKTQVARRVASYVSERSVLNNFASVVSVNVKHISTASDMAVMFARALGISQTEDAFLADLHSRYKASNKCLVVVDGCEIHGELLGEFLSTMAAHGAGLSFLLTSISGFSLRDLASKVYTLRRLPPVDAARLFVARSPRPISEFHPSGPAGIDPFVALSRTKILHKLGGHPGAICDTVAKLNEFNLVEDEARFLHEIIPRALREYESESGRSILNVGLSQFFLPTTPVVVPATPVVVPERVSARSTSTESLDVVPPEVAAALEPLAVTMWMGLHQQAQFAGVSAGAGASSPTDARHPVVWQADFVQKGLESVFAAQAPFLLHKRPLTPPDFNSLIHTWAMPHLNQTGPMPVMPLTGFKAWWDAVQLWLKTMLHAEEDWCCAETVMHGFMGSSEEHRLLRSQPNGAFLFRFSNRNPGLIALSLHNDGKVNSFLVHPTHPGVLLVTQGGGRHKFDSLLEMVSGLPTLTVPVHPTRVPPSTGRPRAASETPPVAPVPSSRLPLRATVSSLGPAPPRRPAALHSSRSNTYYPVEDPATVATQHLQPSWRPT